MRITDDVFDSVDDPAVPVQRAVLRPAARAGHWMVDGADGQHVPRRPRRRRELKKVRHLAKRERLLLAHDLAGTLGTEVRCMPPEMPERSWRPTPNSVLFIVISGLSKLQFVKALSFARNWQTAALCPTPVDESQPIM